MRNTLSRSESLKSYKLIRLLFNNGHSFFSYPYRIFLLEQEADSNVPVKFLISVSKRKIKTAVKRNHIKRLFRESYRTQKHELLEEVKNRGHQLIIAFVFVGDPDIEWLQMKGKTKLALSQIINKLQKPS
jgi:ribonuclease P protein component